jgi:hypothetical protein
MKYLKKAFDILGTASAAVLLIAATILVLAAPIPQILFQLKWCWGHWMPWGFVILVLTCLGLLLTILGFCSANIFMRRSGFLLIQVLAIGLAILHATTTLEWPVLVTAGAFAFSVSLLYGIVSGFVDEAKNAKKLNSTRQP